MAIEMHPILEVIKHRRSVRFFDSKPVPKKIVTTIIVAGNHAPSAGNSQPWRFIVLEDERIKKLLLDITFPKWQKIIEHLKLKGIGVLISDHNVRETLSVCDNAYILSDGKVIESGPPEKIASSETACKAYLGDEFRL